MSKAVYGVKTGTWTEDGGTPVNYADLSTLELNQNATLNRESSNGDAHAHIVYASDIHASARIEGQEISLINTASMKAGDFGVLVVNFPKRAQGKGYTANETFKATINRFVIGPAGIRSAHVGASGWSVSGEACSSDGSTDPVSYDAAAA